MAQLVTARIAARRDWTPGLVTLRLDHEGPDFRPGQFFNLALPGLELPAVDPAGSADRGAGELGGAPTAPLVRRSYSAASAPSAPLEFYLSRVAEGELTPRLFALGVGDEVLLDPGALGFFTLHEVPDADVLWLVATGTGLGPYVSMLRAGVPFERFGRVVVVHGVRTSAELGYAEELRALARGDGRIGYVPVTSRAAPPEGGLEGRITTALASGALESRAGATMNERSQILLCGNPAMIEETVELLKGRGLKKHRRKDPGQYHFEKYW